MEKIQISIVIPCYNSEGNLGELVRQTHIAIKDFSFEMIMINDQSKDDTWNQIISLVKTYPNIRGINLRKNSGQDNALFAGLHYVAGDYAIIMDDDLQHSPHDIPKLYSEVQKGYDVCYANYRVKKQALWKNFGSWFNGKISEIVIDKPKQIYLSPFKIIKHDVVKEILNFKYLYPYIDGIIFSITHNIGQIYVEHHPRYSGRSSYNLIRSVSVFMKLATSFSVIPLRLSSFLGFFSSLIGFLLGIWYLLQYFVSGADVQGWTSLIVILLFMGGLILASIGLVGEYLGRAYLNIIHKPAYTIKDNIVSGQADQHD